MELSIYKKYRRCKKEQLSNSKTKGLGLKRTFLKEYQLYIFLLPTVAYFIIFNYLPMFGIQLAFKDFTEIKGIFGSPFVGFKHFERFFSSYQFWRVLVNTLTLSFMQLILSFPLPIMFALLLHQLTSQRFKKLVQTVTYAPHFISVVVLCGMIVLFLSPDKGIINILLNIFGKESIFFLGDAKYFSWIYLLSGIWQNTGWATILYIAALSSVNPELYEAATIDGANKFQRMIYIDFPGILGIASIMLILNAGTLMDVGFQKVLLLQSPLNLSASEVIGTYIYKIGLVNAQYSYSAAINLFQTVINLILLLSVNKAVKMLDGNALL